MLSLGMLLIRRPHLLLLDEPSVGLAPFLVKQMTKKIKEIRDLAGSSGADLEDEIRNLEKKRNKLQDDVYSRLNRWQRVQLARHPLRPYSLDLVSLIFDDFIELHGDRYFSEDRALVGGFAMLNNQAVMFVGSRKGETSNRGNIGISA